MKRTLLKLSLNLVKKALRLYGWRDEPRPPGFKSDPARCFWRWHEAGSTSQIDTATFAEAINASIKEARGK